MNHIPDAGKMPNACPFCGAGVLILEDGSECRDSGGAWVSFACLTSWHGGYADPLKLQSVACQNAERDRLTAERDRLRGLVNRLVNAGDIMLASTTEIGAREAILRWIDVATEAKP